MDPIIQLLCKDEIEASRKDGLAEGLAKGMIELLQELGLSKEEVFLKIKNKMAIPDSQVQEYIQKYWV